MAVMAFNPLEYAQKLEKAGMKKELAEIHAQTQFEILQSLVEDHAATKQDVKDIRHDIADLKHQIADVRKEIHREVGEVRKEFSRELSVNMQLLSKQLTIRVGYMITGALFVLTTLMKVLHL